MTRDVKPRRKYESAHRRTQAATTRRTIVAAAGSLFETRGYAGTTMSEVASAAGVVVETVYRAYGSKAALFTAVVEAALAGGIERAEVPVEQRSAIAAIIAQPDPRRQVELYAATQPGIHRRAGPVLRAVRDAAALDSEVARVWSGLEAQRFAGQRRFTDRLAARGALRDDVDADGAADMLFALTSLALHDILVVERSWSPDRYQELLTSSLIRALLPIDVSRVPEPEGPAEADE
ncbi:MAG: helix-turn-helix domain-containing protein [Chloroflexota bacterium]